MAAQKTARAEQIAAIAARRQKAAELALAIGRDEVGRAGIEDALAGGLIAKPEHAGLIRSLEAREAELKARAGAIDRTEAFLASPTGTPPARAEADAWWEDVLTPGIVALPPGARETIEDETPLKTQSTHRPLKP